jgi:glycosyltransferase involved in cell wall biosynthesis
MRISLCLMVYDELAGCQRVVPQLPRDDFDEVYAVDGGSRDGTATYLESQGIRVHRQPKPSINAAYACAVDQCHTDALVVFFPKGTLYPACCLAVADKLREGYAMVVTSRDMPGARNEEDRKLLKPRKWGIRVLSRFASLIWRREGWRVRDVLHGVKGFTVDAFRRMRIAEVGVTIDLEMVVRAYRLRLPRTELPVVESVRSYSHSRFPIWRTGKRLAWFLARELFTPTPAALAQPGSGRPESSPASTPGPVRLNETVKPLPHGESAG